MAYDDGHEWYEGLYGHEKVFEGQKCHQGMTDQESYVMIGLGGRLSPLLP